MDKGKEIVEEEAIYATRLQKHVCVFWCLFDIVWRIPANTSNIILRGPRHVKLVRNLWQW